MKTDFLFLSLSVLSLFDHVVSATVPVCTPSSGGSETIDDTPSIYSAIQQCGQGGIIQIPQSQTFNLLSPLNFSQCVSCDFQLEGILKFSENVDFWNGQRAMIAVTNVANITFRSLTGSGLIDGNGQAAWERFAVDTTLRRPTLFVISNSTDIAITGIRARNPQNVFYSVGSKSSRIVYSRLDLSAISNSTTNPKNTDGFDIGDSAHVTVDNVSVLNQDDCIAFKAGINDLNVSNITCDGSHGLSVGSLAKSPNIIDQVQNVYVKGAVMRNCAKAAGIKIYPGGPTHGYAIVNNVTWEDITIDNCDFAFQVSACYGSNATYCTANPSNSTITGITLKYFTGTTSSKYSPTVAQFFCPTEGDKCQIEVEQWSVQSPTRTSRVECDNISNSMLGIDCVETTPS